MNICYAHTMPGVEEIAWLEIRERLSQATLINQLFAKDENGIVVFQFEGSLDELSQLRTVETVFMQALHLPKVSRQKRDLSQIHDLMWKSDEVGRAANQFMRQARPNHPITYQVVTRKFGKHRYRRKELEMAVVKGLEKRYPRWQSVSNGGKMRVSVELLGSELLVGMELPDIGQGDGSGEGIRPSIAAALTFLTDPDKADVFLDPICGAGSVLLERRQSGPYATILGGDADAKSVTAAERQLGRRRRQTGPSVVLTTTQWDAQYLPLAGGSVDKIAAALPSQAELGSAAAVRRFYRGAFAEMGRVLRRNGRVVILSSEYDEVKDAIRRQSALAIMTGYSVTVGKTWGRIYIIEPVDEGQ